MAKDANAAIDVIPLRIVNLSPKLAAHAYLDEPKVESMLNAFRSGVPGPGYTPELHGLAVANVRTQEGSITAKNVMRVTAPLCALHEMPLDGVK